MQKLPIIADVHMHTLHSHGQASTRDMYNAAVKAGLTIIGFSEHSPRPEGYIYPLSDYQGKLRAEFPIYVQEVLNLKKEAAPLGIKVLLGLELDYIRGQEDFARLECRRYPYDYIIGGLHFQGTWGFDGGEQTWAALGQDEKFAAYAKYYDDLVCMCETGLFHIVAHPDLIKIYSIADFNRWLDTDAACPLITKALESIKDNHMVMEISSAGLRKKCKEIYPGPKIMALAQKLDIPISFGADAHCTGTPAYAFDILARYAAEFGYGYSYIYEQGKPQKMAFSCFPAAGIF